MLEQKINEIKRHFMDAINKVQSKDDLFRLEKKFLGRKSEFINILKNLKDLDIDEKRRIGELANQVKNEMAGYIAKERKYLGVKTEKKAQENKQGIDVTLPGKEQNVGHLNPISIVRREIEDIFTAMGYEIADGPEVENEFYNFDSLNIPKDHPSRDMQDTFWLSQKVSEERSKNKELSGGKLSMRSQTSAIQARYMQKHKPPFKVIAPGKCFRREATDMTHDHTFYQFEALVVGEKITVANLKFVAEAFFSQFFNQDIKIRLRPSYFPFVEPGFEYDISCTMCGGKGCSACKGNGWLELGGAGMVNQNVFVAAGYPRHKYTGFAWGIGLERLAMMKYKIDDIRLFNSGDLRFVRQF